jgi:hypothetical protein
VGLRCWLPPVTQFLPRYKNPSCNNGPNSTAMKSDGWQAGPAQSCRYSPCFFLYQRRPGRPLHKGVASVGIICPASPGLRSSYFLNLRDVDYAWNIIFQRLQEGSLEKMFIKTHLGAPAENRKLARLSASRCGPSGTVTHEDPRACQPPHYMKNQV